MLRHIAAALALISAAAQVASAQFKEEAFTQSYADPNDTTARDTTDKLFSFKEFFGGVSHKRDVRIGTLFAGSMLFIGSEQIYNRDYWKLPVVYGGIGAGVGLGTYYRLRYNKTGELKDRQMSTWMFAGAGLVYWGTLMDGMIRYKRDVYPNPGKATIYSILLPGLGQVYNGEAWKVPLYWGFMAGATHFLLLNNTNYKRYKRIHNEATGEDAASYNTPISGETAKYYRDVFRRYRDYSIVALMGFYLLQVIDANVFAYMQDFEVNDDLSIQIRPTVITPDVQYAAVPAPGTSAFGLSIGLKF
ncbi:MAG: hypothetical protein IJM35_10125 [Bacteroidales bacterium]|jgi:hypothetical protein|nr:hypothetical protein [Bacteroidales bacterium]